MMKIRRLKAYKQYGFFFFVAILTILYFWTIGNEGCQGNFLCLLRSTSTFDDQSFYRDCKGRTLAELRETFNRDGIVVFKPCSMKYKEKEFGLLSKVKEFMDTQCGNDKPMNTCSNRIAKSSNPGVLEIARDEEILHVISGLHERTAFPFQTLNFKWGTSQPFHSDLIHFAGYPSMTLTAAWTALEDIHPDAGPLEYFVGSHKEEFLNMQDLGCPLGKYGCYENGLRKYISKKRMTPSSVVAEKGDVIIWASNAIHGGSAVKDESRTRYSQVTHYFLEGDDYYIQPKLSVFENKVLTKFSPRLDVPFKTVAKNFIAEHWNPKSGSYISHHTTHHKNNYYDMNGVDTGEAVTALSKY